MKFTKAKLTIICVMMLVMMTACSKETEETINRASPLHLQLLVETFYNEAARRQQVFFITVLTNTSENPLIVRELQMPVLWLNFSKEGDGFEGFMIRSLPASYIQPDIIIIEPNQSIYGLSVMGFDAGSYEFFATYRLHDYDTEVNWRGEIRSSTVSLKIAR